ncbi:uncharacterized protein LOC115541674 isoform X2 [Gadus morhua]|uniref:uncharacterized protein LOC115541674 isoform X2 n=1 Tax=Gadus morhua TaxID=8049 RepID=UPI0011B3A56C|nr:uncharacterized protein LOC115541674 isoform X2 [Gadus morhua]
MGAMKVSNVFTPPQIIMMSWTYVFLPVILGAVVSCQDVLSNPVVELTVRPGQNVTLYCDCKLTPGVNLVWYRNCSHENQPTLSLNWKDRDQDIFGYGGDGGNFFHLNMMLNDSSNSYDLLIKNITDSHLGLYYCGTEELNGEKGNKKESMYTYGKIITRILFDIPLDAGAGDPAAADCGQCWMLLIILCPSSALLSLFLYFLCSHMVRAGKHPGISQETRPLTLQDEDENYSRVFYAVLETPQHKGSHSFFARSTSGL